MMMDCEMLMLIDLTSIKEEGLTCEFDQFSLEMGRTLFDLIGKAPFRIRVVIKPLANAFKVSGSFESRTKDICSLCGHEIHYPINSSINEIVVIEKKRPRNTQVSQSLKNLSSVEPGVTYINKYQFDLKEFLHEIVAFSLEDFPVCLDRVTCQSRQFKFKGESRIDRGHPGFNVLKNIKLPRLHRNQKKSKI